MSNSHTFTAERQNAKGITLVLAKALSANQEGGLLVKLTGGFI